MSDTVKLIIEIPKKDYEWAKQIAEPADKSIYYERQLIAISNGTPLDTVKAEIEKEIIPRNSDDYDHGVMFQNCGLRMALKIIDNIGKGDEE